MEHVKPLIRKAYRIGESTVIAIAPPVVKNLNIDDMTYFEQRVTDDGCIILQPRRLK